MEECEGIRKAGVPAVMAGRRLHATRIAILIFTLLSISTAPLRAENEAIVKAAYLFNFAKLVEWPASAFDRAQAPIVIGITGRDAVADELTRTFGRATANGRPLEIRRVSAGNAAALKACHIIFVPESENADGIIATLQGSPVLIVGESEGFVRRGGALGFVKVNDNLKFEANPKAATRGGVTVSSKLLRVAQNVIQR